MGTKKLPNKKGRYLVTIKTDWGNQVRQADRCKSHIGSCEWSVLPDGGQGSSVIVWQKCPEPYKED